MKDYTHLSIIDRRRLYVFREMGLSMAEIARRLGRSRSTLYRELARNQEPEGYFPVLAHEKAAERVKNGRESKLKKESALHEYVVRGLKKGWSPEQIAGRMKLKKTNYYACSETIYQYIYNYPTEKLYSCLTYKKRKRHQRRVRKPQICRYGNSRLITQRPADIATRKRFGHWEGDTIEFSDTKKARVTTVVERKSRVVLLIKNESKHSRGVMKGIKDKLEKLPPQMRKTITFDQGTEFADHPHLEQQIHCKVYYCEPRSPWQKGSNENMNGRLRRYLPRATPTDQITQNALDALAEKMNQCPRKCLGFKTPNELFIQQFKNDCRTWT